MDLQPSDSWLASRVKDRDWIVFFVELSEFRLSPRGALEALLVRPYPFLLESASGNQKIARFSLVGSDPYQVIWSRGKKAFLLGRAGEDSWNIEDPFGILRTQLQERPTLVPEVLQGFVGGAVGFFGYDMKNQIERLPDTVKDDLHMPEMFWAFVDEVLVFDRVENTTRILVQAPFEGNLSRCRRYAVDKARSFLARFEVKRSRVDHEPFRFGDILSNHTPESHRIMVERCKEYIAAGDIFQANLSQRLKTPFQGDPFLLYESLARINPSPFAFFFGFPDFQLVSCSPERLVCLEGSRVQTRPIAGTRPRGSNVEEDEALCRELILNPKERAEHIMIVDMARNDIGRVCRYGTVLLDELMVIEPYSHVFHIVTNVTGRLNRKADSMDLVRAVFPGASITGVPKVRCMEIIDELEDVRRGPYTGSAGWISFTGDMDLNIIIRTLLLRCGFATIHVGGGIVWDSEPRREFEETLHKGRALLEALEMAQKENA